MPAGRPPLYESKEQVADIIEEYFVTEAFIVGKNSSFLL